MPNDQITYVLPPSNEVYESTESPELAQIMNILQRNEIQQQQMMNDINILNAKIDNQNEKIEKIMQFIANIEKFMKLKQTKTPEVIEEQIDCDFIEPNCKTAHDLQNFDLMLEKDEYRIKFINFYKNQYDVNGKRDGCMIFRTIARRIISPGALEEYSWKGQNKKNSRPKISFQNTFQNIVEIMYKICSLSDITYSREKTEREFVKLLRFKNMNAKREESRGNVSTKNSTSRSKKISKTSEEETI